MTSYIDTLPTVQVSTIVPERKSLPKREVIVDDYEKLIDQLSDHYEQSRLIHSNVRYDTLVVLWLGQKGSSLRIALTEYLIPEDITLILFSTEEQLWHWLDTNYSVGSASLIVQANINTQEIVSRSHVYDSIRSILVRCKMNELNSLRQFAGSYIKIDGIYDDDTRLLIKLFIDLALLSEEIGDEQREDKNNELEAQRNYDRAVKLCALARTL